MDKGKIMVSICCVTYNHEKYIAEALEGFVMQKANFAFEILIHDDASTDNTQQIIKEFETKYPSIIKPIYQVENQKSKMGSGVNIKYNYKRSLGNYIALCEGDDYWTDPYKLQKQVDFLEENPKYSGCFHYTPVVFHGVKGKNARLFGFHKSKLDLTGEDTISTLAPWHTSSFVFRKKAFQQPNWMSTVVSGDMVIFSAVARSGMIRCIPEEMSVYRKNSGGVTNTNAHKELKFHENRIELIKRLNELHEYKYQDKTTEVINHHQRKIDGIKETVNHKDNKKYFSFFRKLMKKLNFSYGS